MSKVEEFLNAVKKGAGRVPSSGERICFWIGIALAEIGDNAAAIEPELLEGACELLRQMGGPWDTSAEKEAVFNSLKEALK